MTQTRLSVFVTLLALASVTACSTDPANAAPATGQEAKAPAAGATPLPGAGIATGTVAETMNAGGYTYLRLQTGKSDLWIAATELPVKIGEHLTVPLEMPMENFHSKTLNRDFPLIYFVSQVAREGEALGPLADQPPVPMGSHSPGAGSEEPVERMSPAPGAVSIADVWSQRAALANKSVVTRGKVVKVNNGIMGRNWVHLQDGSGSAADRTNDLIVTTNATLVLGDVVTVSGVLGVGKDFGSGYTYEVILENAAVSGR